MNTTDQPSASALAQTTWEHLPFLRANAARQMAIDSVMASLCGSGSPRAILRLYSMDPPSVTIGRHQRWRSVVDDEECRRRGWEWARRPTGGGALLHRDEINYAVAASHDVFGGERNFNHAYYCIMRGLSTAIELLGGRPTLNMGRVTARSGPASSAHGLCEQSLTHFEISVDGKKAVAAAQWYTADAVLQHGTIYLRAPAPADRFWPLRPHARLSNSRASAWWDVAAGGAHFDAKTGLVAQAIQDGLTRALHLNWSVIDYDQINQPQVDTLLNEWVEQDWNHRR